MKVTMKALAMVAALSALHAAPAFAQKMSDDTKWINQCVSDNKDEGQNASVIQTYCTCMNNKMSSDETRSITQWEKSNPRAMEACSREAGWTGK